MSEAEGNDANEKMLMVGMATDAGHLAFFLKSKKGPLGYKI